jgi:hypothetical protein
VTGIAEPSSDAPVDTVASTARITWRDWLRRAWPPLLILTSGFVVLSLVLLDAPGTVRAAPVLVYLAVIPGLAWVRLIRLPDHLMAALVGVAVSFAFGIGVAEAMIYLHRWSPVLGLSTLVVIASFAALIELVRPRPASGLHRPPWRRTP